MADGLQFRKPDATRYAQDLDECILVEGEPIRIYAVTGGLLREYRDFCRKEIPESDRFIISGQVMIQWRESDVAFSKKDLMTAARFRFAEIRLIGRSIIFTLKPANGSWPDPDFLSQKYEEIQRSTALADRLAQADSRKFRETSWDPEVDLLKLRNDFICSEISRIFPMEYRKTPYTGCYLPPERITLQKT